MALLPRLFSRFGGAHACATWHPAWRIMAELDAVSRRECLGGGCGGEGREALATPGEAREGVMRMAEEGSILEVGSAVRIRVGGKERERELRNGENVRGWGEASGGRGGGGSLLGRLGKQAMWGGNLGSAFVLGQGASQVRAGNIVLEARFSTEVREDVADAAVQGGVEEQKRREGGGGGGGGGEDGSSEEVGEGRESDMDPWSSVQGREKGESSDGGGGAREGLMKEDAEIHGSAQTSRSLRKKGLAAEPGGSTDSSRRRKKEGTETLELKQMDTRVMVGRPDFGKFAPFNRDLQNRDKLILRGLLFHGFHGVLEEERRLGQKFRVDIDAVADLRRAGTSDNVRDTVSYADIYMCVKEVLEGPPFRLLEAVAAAIARRTFERFVAVRSLRIRVGKPHVAVPGVVEYLGVDIVRHRSFRTTNVAATPKGPVGSREEEEGEGDAWDELGRE